MILQELQKQQSTKTNLLTCYSKDLKKSFEYSKKIPSFSNTYKTNDRGNKIEKQKLQKKKVGKIVSKQQSQQIGLKHYFKAMKWVQRKNNQQKKISQKAKFQQWKDQITNQHTFHPVLYQQSRSKQSKQQRITKKVNELQKWGINNNSQRRQIYIQGQVKLMRLVTDIQNRSLQISRNKSSKKINNKSKMLITASDFHFDHKNKDHDGNNHQQYLLKRIQY